MQNEPIEVTLRVTAVLEQLGIPYVIGGSLASTLHGMIRTTQDSDIITEMQAKHIQPFVSSLQNEFFIDEEMIADAIRRNSSFNIIHRDTMFKVDIFIPHQRPFQQSQLARANGKPLNLKLNKALILPVQKILSCQNLNGIDWAERYQKDNGAIFLGS